GQLRRVAQSREYDDGGAVLVVVEDGNVQARLQPVLDLEAPGCADVLEVDAAERRRDAHDALDDVVDVLGVKRNRYGVDTPEVLEEKGLALHDRQRRRRSDVAETENGGAVGHDGDGVALPGVVVHQVRLVGNREAHFGNAGRVSEGKVVAVAQRHLRV